MQTAKQITNEILDSLPDDCTLDDISYRLYFWRKMELGEKAIKDGHVYTTEEVREIIKS